LVFPLLPSAKLSQLDGTNEDVFPLLEIKIETFQLTMFVYQMATENNELPISYMCLQTLTPHIARCVFGLFSSLSSSSSSSSSSSQWPPRSNMFSDSDFDFNRFSRNWTSQ